MAEYSSLYIKVNINEQKFAKFYAAKPLVHPIDDNWCNWWDTRAMYHKQPLTAIPTYTLPNHKTIFDQLLADQRAGCFSRYDADKQEWIFVCIFFSENYSEILPMLSVLKSLQTYSLPLERSTALIYDFYWGGTDVMAAMSLSPDEQFLTETRETAAIDTDVLATANRTMEDVLEELSKRYED